jgi:hypothetical protein
VEVLANSGSIRIGVLVADANAANHPKVGEKVLLLASAIPASASL